MPEDLHRRSVATVLFHEVHDKGWSIRFEEAAQLLALFADDLLRETAGHASAMARRLDEAVAAEGIELGCPVQANVVFPALSATAIERVQRRYRLRPWGEDAGVTRWMCSWQTTTAGVDGLVAALPEAAV